MIKIQEHLNRGDAEKYLDSIALKLWNYFNPMLADGSDYQNRSLIKRLETIISKTGDNSYLVQFASSDKNMLERQKKFLTYLQNKDYAKLKALVISRPEDLLILKDEILELLLPTDIFYENGNISQTPFGNLLVDKLFIYKKFRSSSICPELISDLQMKNIYCPYCNQNRVQVIDVSEEDNEQELNKAYLDIDHFYPKSINPYFAISFYNLIPSCHTCNSNEKGNKEFCISTHTNPYHKSYNDNHKFTIDDDYLLNGATSEVRLTKKNETNDFNDKDLKLSQRFRHTYLEPVNELIENYLNYQHYRESPDFNHDYVDVLTQRVPKSKNDILKSEAGKMYRDIFKEIDVYDLL
ncbi:HNH endonuclease domain-containing protein [Zobellia sp. 1_MG-2023]|uniref:HNH endonuclease domain-containing protein n=1 Tax=Zobellia sp. 1_MG-2023 TaxID=3062626 RepID=UPI0026E47F48|nr:HNH endonuclease domain-containing protein [Zobellia sp. 1_MG-2023]MDO6818911.1 HNH endonuclease domain-containing protein [Zobellia sp. 1_MG-2023]